MSVLPRASIIVDATDLTSLGNIALGTILAPNSVCVQLRSVHTYKLIKDLLVKHALVESFGLRPSEPVNDCFRYTNRDVSVFIID